MKLLEKPFLCYHKNISCSGAWQGCFWKDEWSFWKCQPSYLTNEGNCWVLNRLKPSYLTIFWWFHTFKAVYLKVCFSFTNSWNPQVEWVIKNYRGLLLLIDKWTYLTVNKSGKMYYNSGRGSHKKNEALQCKVGLLHFTLF